MKYLVALLNVYNMYVEDNDKYVHSSAILAMLSQGRRAGRGKLTLGAHCQPPLFLLGG
jgi:hypothetical protein